MSSGAWTKTIHGKDAYECISALQKEIRRGNELAALTWAMELAPKQFDWLLKRLTVISHEDIGCADIEAVNFVTLAMPQLREWKKKDASEWILVLTNIVMALARAAKSRDADELQCVVRGRFAREGLPEVPDYALDKHTQRGKKMGRGMDHFFDVGAQLVPEPAQADYREEAEGYWRASEQGELDLDAYSKEMTEKPLF